MEKLEYGLKQQQFSKISLKIVVFPKKSLKQQFFKKSVKIVVLNKNSTRNFFKNPLKQQSKISNSSWIFSQVDLKIVLFLFGTAEQGVSMYRVSHFIFLYFERQLCHLRNNFMMFKIRFHILQTQTFYGISSFSD